MPVVSTARAPDANPSAASPQGAPAGRDRALLELERLEVAEAARRRAAGPEEDERHARVPGERRQAAELDDVDRRVAAELEDEERVVEERVAQRQRQGPPAEARLLDVQEAVPGPERETGERGPAVA